MFQLFKSTITFLFLSSITAAQANEFYLITTRGEPEIRRESYSCLYEQQNVDTSEWEIFVKETKNIAAHFNKKLLQNLHEARSQVGKSPKMPMWEAGMGYRFECIIPLALELKITARNNGHALYSSFYSGAKAFLPVGSKTRLYTKTGKAFALINPNRTEKTLLDMTPREQWRNSITLFGIGVTRVVFSKLEADLSINGHTQREAKRIYYSASLGFNYFF